MLGQWYHLSREDIEQKVEAMSTLLQLQELDIPGDEFQSLVIANLLDYLRKEQSERKEENFKWKLYHLKQLNPDGKTALVADDSIYVHHYLGTYLTELGFHIAGFARNGNEAVQYALNVDPVLITMDCTMPGKSGIEAAREIFDKSPGVKIIFITALGEHPDFLEHLKAEFPGMEYQVITKPFTKKHLSEAVDQLNIGI